MLAKISNNGNLIRVEGMTELESSQLSVTFTKKIPDWFIIKKMAPNANINESFVMNGNIIPSGLWVELCNMCKKYGFSLSFSDTFNDLMFDSVTKDEYNRYVENLFEKSEIKPKDYQIDAAFSMLKYKKSCIEVATNGGKTLICYMIFKYLREVKNIKRILYITPKTVLTTQSADKFKEYDDGCGVVTDWTFDEIHGAIKKKDKKKVEYTSDIIFGNYQSLCKKDANFFKQFDCVILDEAHHAGGAKTIQTIFNKCVNAEYKMGLTGTFPKENTYESFILQSFIGPLVYRLSSYDLIKVENFSTPVHIYGIRMMYLPESRRKELHNKREYKNTEDPTAGNALYNEERQIARGSQKRFDWICNFVTKFDKNTLVVFCDKQTKYGYRIYEFIKEYSSKDVYYIDGDTKTKVRDNIKKSMEDDKSGNTIIVSSIGCFSEGIDISNLWNIVLVESTKSDIVIAQLLGRGMRRYEGKPMTRMFDIFDDFSYGKDSYKDNYLLKHYKERERIYKERKFDYMGIIDVDLVNTTLF